LILKFKRQKKANSAYYDEATITIPVVFLLNRFENATINGWDGRAIVADQGSSSGSIIMSNFAGFGSKNADNSFLIFTPYNQNMPRLDKILSRRIQRRT
jgi:hypothetical protein